MFKHAITYLNEYLHIRREYRYEKNCLVTVFSFKGKNCMKKRNQDKTIDIQYWCVMLDSNINKSYLYLLMILERRDRDDN